MREKYILGCLLFFSLDIYGSEINIKDPYISSSQIFIKDLEERLDDDRAEIVLIDFDQKQIDNDFPFDSQIWQSFWHTLVIRVDLFDKVDKTAKVVQDKVTYEDPYGKIRIGVYPEDFGEIVDSAIIYTYFKKDNGNRFKLKLGKNNARIGYEIKQIGPMIVYGELGRNWELNDNTLLVNFKVGL